MHAIPNIDITLQIVLQEFGGRTAEPSAAGAVVGASSLAAARPVEHLQCRLGRTMPRRIKLAQITLF